VTPGFFTPDGSARFAARYPALAAQAFYRTIPAGAVSSLGLGTYLGKPDETTSARYVEAILAAINGGINTFDTAINYRYTRSEQDLGEALRRAFSENLAARDELLIATKAGFLTAGAVPSNLHPSHLAGDSHCLHPDFIADQIARSRAHLHLDTIDVFYLHNPETQLSHIPLDKLEQRLLDAFTRLEQLCASNQIRFYGAATWSAFRLKPGQPNRLSLPRVLELARQAGGDDHHFRFLQLPFNLGMPEAFTFPHVLLDNEPVNVLEVAARSGVTVVASAALHQARLVNGIPRDLRAKWSEPQSDPEFALQFARSAPGVAFALAGMSQSAHVRENLGIGAYPPAPADAWLGVFHREN
jgi:aryl-alcohol dehydrogenase-like predicted oxidoreductase